MKLSNKIGVVSIVIAIIGIVIAIIGNDKKISNIQTTSGDSSPAISNTNGNININK